MPKLTPYINEIVSLIVMLLMLIALVSGEMNAQAYKLTSLDASSAEATQFGHVRLEDE